MTNQPNIGPELLQHAGLSSGTLTLEDRAALLKKIQRVNRDIKRLKTIALSGLALLLFCVAIVAVARNGPDANHGIRLTITRIGVIGFLAGFYGLLGAMLLIFVHRVAGRALEVSSRLANMEVLLASAVHHLDRLAQRLENSNQPPRT
jgi:hypothetical protein